MWVVVLLVMAALSLGAPVPVRFGRHPDDPSGRRDGFLRVSGKLWMAVKAESPDPVR